MDDGRSKGDAESERTTDGEAEGAVVGKDEGPREGEVDGAPDGIVAGELDGSCDDISDGLLDGKSAGATDDAEGKSGTPMEKEGSK